MAGQRQDIRICGFGGQGVVLSGYIIGKAAALYDNKNAVFTQSYGPEARGGACSACVVIDEGEICNPLVHLADFLIVLSSEGYEQYVQTVRPDGLTFADSGLVKEVAADNVKAFGIEATRLAEGMGNKIVANVIMLGFFCAITGILSKEAVIESVKSSVKRDFVDSNLRAFERGYEYGREISG